MIQVKGEIHMNESIWGCILICFGLTFVALVVYALFGWIFYSVTNYFKELLNTLEEINTAMQEYIQLRDSEDEDDNKEEDEEGQ